MNGSTPSSQLLKVLTYVGLLVGVLANIGGVLGIFGIGGSIQLGIVILITGICITGYALLVRYILILRTNTKSEIPLTRISVIQSLNLRDANEIHILGSGTETWYGIVSELFASGALRDGISIHIGFRVGGDSKRHTKLLAFAEKWDRMAGKHRLSIKYYPYVDFFFMMRGLVIDNNLGFVGFYHRTDTDTIGAEKSLMFVKGENKAAAYLIENFLTIFSTLKSVDKMSDVIPNS